MPSCVRVVFVGALCFAWALTGSVVALAVAPTITGITPNNGSVAGGTSVTITGTGFPERVSMMSQPVKFGNSLASSVTAESSTRIKATSPPGSGLVNISVTNFAGETSVPTPYDQFGYDPIPSGLWLGLNNNTVKYLGAVNAFSQHNVVYDRSFELTAGQLPSELEKGTEKEEFEERLREDNEYGMIPVSLIEYKSA